MAFSTRLDITWVILTSSTCATTGLKLSNNSSIFFFAASGFNLFSTSSSSSFILTDDMLSTDEALSSLTMHNKSSIILFSLSISLTISSMNSLYTSTGTFSCVLSESANTFMDVIGVLSSCDTFETNSDLEESSSLFLSIILLKWAAKLLSSVEPLISILLSV